MKVYTVKCPKCGDRIYSRARHDFRYCSCNYLFVDGGFEYTRIGAESLDNIDAKEIVYYLMITLWRMAITKICYMYTEENDVCYF